MSENLSRTVIDIWKLVGDEVSAVEFPDGSRRVRDGIPCGACERPPELCPCGRFALAPGAIVFEAKLHNARRFGYEVLT